MTPADNKTNQLSLVMMEIDHILDMIAEAVLPDDINSDRTNGLHALFQEKVKKAVALRFELGCSGKKLSE